MKRTIAILATLLMLAGCQAISKIAGTETGTRTAILTIEGVVDGVPVDLSGTYEEESEKTEEREEKRDTSVPAASGLLGMIAKIAGGLAVAGGPLWLARNGLANSEAGKLFGSFLKTPVRAMQDKEGAT